MKIKFQSFVFLVILVISIYTACYNASNNLLGRNNLIGGLLNTLPKLDLGIGLIPPSRSDEGLLSSISSLLSGFAKPITRASTVTTLSKDPTNQGSSVLANQQFVCTTKNCFTGDSITVLGLLSISTASTITTKNFNMVRGTVRADNATIIQANQMSLISGVLQVLAPVTIKALVAVESLGVVDISSHFISNGLTSNSGAINISLGATYNSTMPTVLTNNSLVNSIGTMNTPSFQITDSRAFFNNGDLATETFENLKSTIKGNGGSLKADNYKTDSNNHFTGMAMEIDSLSTDAESVFDFDGGLFNTKTDQGSFSISGSLSIFSSSSQLTPKSFNLKGQSGLNLRSSILNINSQFSSTENSKIDCFYSDVKFQGQDHSLNDQSSLSFNSSRVGFSSDKLSFKNQSTLNLVYSDTSSSSEINAAGQSSVFLNSRCNFTHNGKTFKFNDQSAFTVSNSKADFNTPFHFDDQSKISTNSNAVITLNGENNVGTFSGNSVLSLSQSSLHIDSLALLNLTGQSSINLKSGFLNVTGHISQGSLSNIVSSQSSIHLGSVSDIGGSIHMKDGSLISVSSSSRVNLNGNINISSSAFINNGTLNLNEDSRITVDSGKFSNANQITILGQINIEGSSVFTNLENGTMEVHSGLKTDGNSNTFANHGSLTFMNNSNNSLSQFTNNGTVNVIESILTTTQLSHEQGQISLVKSTISGHIHIKNGSLSGVESVVNGDVYHESGAVGSANSPTTLNVTGNFNQTGDATISVFIDVDHHNNSLSTINIGQHVNFNGTLEITLNHSNLENLVNREIPIANFNSYSGNITRLSIRSFNPASGSSSEVSNECARHKMTSRSLSIMVESADLCAPKEGIFSDNKKKTILYASVSSSCVLFSVSTAAFIWKRRSIATFLKIRRESRLMRQSMNSRL